MPTLTFSPIAIKGMTTHYVDVMVLYTKLSQPPTLYFRAIYKHIAETFYSIPCVRNDDDHHHHHHWTCNVLSFRLHMY